MLGGLTLAILLVGVVYAMLLHGLHPLERAAAHRRTPAARRLAALMALLVAVRAAREAALERTLVVEPLSARSISSTPSRAGQLDGRYPYPFIDVGKLGWLQVGAERRRHRASASFSPASRWSGSTAGVHLGRRGGSR